MQLGRDEQVRRNTFVSFLRLLPLQAPGKTKTRKHSLLVFDGVIAGVAHPDLELEAHDGVAGALAAALATHGLPALPAVMLQQDRKEGKEECNFCWCLPVSRQRCPVSVGGWAWGRFALNYYHPVQCTHLHKRQTVSTLVKDFQRSLFYWSNTAFYSFILSD